MSAGHEIVCVQDLVPGDVIGLDGEQATFIAQRPHPRWPHLRLVVWRLSDGTLSPDALSPGQQVGARLPLPDDELAMALLRAIDGGNVRRPAAWGTAGGED